MLGDYESTSATKAVDEGNPKGQPGGGTTPEKTCDVADLPVSHTRCRSAGGGGEILE